MQRQQVKRSKVILPGQKIDQTQGQTALPGYGYGPFQYAPYPNGFYGPPGFFPGPFNGTFPPGNGYNGFNVTNGQFPNGPYPSNGYFPPFPYPQPFPNAQQPNQNDAAAKQTSPENGQGNPENGHANGNGTGYGPFGFPGPFYGDYYPFGYPGVPFNGLPYRFHDPLLHRYKGLSLGPVPYGHFPFGPFGPYGPCYPNQNGQQPGTDHEKPAQGEAANAMADAGAMNSDAEVISESGSSVVESSPAKPEKFLIPWPLVKGSDNLGHKQVLNQLS